MVGDVRARFETELVKGLVPILDMTGWSLKHITKASIFSVRKYIKYCQVRAEEHSSFAFAAFSVKIYRVINKIGLMLRKPNIL